MVLRVPDQEVVGLLTTGFRLSAGSTCIQMNMLPERPGPALCACCYLGRGASACFWVRWATQIASRAM